MIRYSLKCTEGHAFEAWFPSADAYDGLRERGLVSCAVCGSIEVEKAVMAPRVGGLSEPATAVEAKIAALRRKVEAEATYVGGRFAEEARAIHQSETPDRAIYGEANAAEVRGLLADGVPVAPLPFRPKTKAN
ncbi:DUF1178 family protein [Jannaschia sp. S6380]|uniref:DUF1178 family protein n=1 Tax=Jannaschia sp. S6380 TaxID=2926408 RepID=UPI001FF446B5|nr:DUF1178 family protein [Jannaschia sp. S6380]MCK0166295.1 DUF1178 family protein [Jannaschia sp. S6380]